MPDYSAEKSTPIWARPASVFGFVLLVLFIKAMVAAGTELSRDEGYYAMWSLNLSWSYFDHAPGVAWVIAFSRFLFGEGELQVRLPAIISTGGIALALYRLGQVLFDRRIAALSIYWYLLSIAAALLLLVITPDPLSTLFWTLTILAMTELMRSDNGNWWLVVGMCAGAGLLSKYTNFFLAPGIVLWLIANRSRWRWFAAWQLWAGGALALIMFSPVLFYNAAHNWESFTFQAGRGVVRQVLTDGFPGDLVDFFVAQILLYSPGVFGLLIVAFVLCFFPKRKGYQGLHLIVLTSLPLLAYFLAYSFQARVEANWPMPVWPVLTLAAAWTATSIVPANFAAKTLLLLAKWSVVPLGVIITALIYVQAVFQPWSLEAIDRTRDMHGWRAATEEIAQLAQQNGAKWIALNHDYSVTGLMAYYNHMLDTGLPVHDLDEPFRYRQAPPLPEDIVNAPAIFISDIRTATSASPPTGLFEQARLLGIFERQHEGDVFGRIGLFLADTLISSP